jgi:hypothetical protein
MANYNTSSGNHTFNDEIRVDDIKNNAGTGLPSLNGTSPEIKWQKKTLSSDVITATTISDLTFNNLVNGNTYKVHFNPRFETNPLITSSVSLAIKNGATTIHTLNWRDSSSDADQPGGVTVIFTAGATSTLTFETSGTWGANEQRLVATDTIAILEELAYHTETTDFT